MKKDYALHVDKAKVGAVVGLVAGFALFSSFISIDVQLGLPNGTFYKTIGVPLGLDGFGAVTFGFLAHMGTAALIGACFCIASNIWRTFKIVTVPKGILTGAFTGIIVFTIFFLPIHHFVMMPAVIDEFSVIDDSRLSVAELDALYNLLVQSDIVLWFALFYHILFGAVLGLMSGMILHEEYSKVPRIRKFL